MLAQKLEGVMKKAREGLKAQGANAAAPLKSAKFFDLISEGVKKDPALAKSVKAVFQFNVSPGGAWAVDLKNGAGSVTTGQAPKADCTIDITDDNFVALAEGKLNPQSAFMQGKIKIKGNMMLAQKLDKLLKTAKTQSKL
eukprot:GFYU01001674.1.p2 GENE.GFYU01001674.1~~GFYU01001674.1.p2  ORF type:complete len:164 (-),score=76.46 GFYU01001674.1:140-559(-)